MTECARVQTDLKSIKFNLIMFNATTSAALVLSLTITISQSNQTGQLNVNSGSYKHMQLQW